MIPADTGVAASASSSSHRGPPFDVTAGMNVWRRLLGHDSRGDAEVPIEQGGPILSDRTYRDVLIELRGRPEAERLIMSVAVVSYIRALMVEMGEVCHEASLSMMTLDQTDDEVLVEVPEEGDEAGLMQTDVRRWARLLAKLQKDLVEQSKGLCRTHVDLLLGRLRSAVGSGSA